MRFSELVEMVSKGNEEEKIALRFLQGIILYLGIHLDISHFRFYFWYMYTGFHMVFHAKGV